MSDPKKPDEDMIASAPEEISDDKLEGVDGGYLRYTMTNLKSSTTGPNADTIYAGSANDLMVGIDTDTAFGGSPDDAITTNFKLKR